MEILTLTHRPKLTSARISLAFHTIARGLALPVQNFISKLTGGHHDAEIAMSVAGAKLKIGLKRIDIINCDAAFGNIQLFM